MNIDNTIKIDFTSGKLRYRHQHLQGRNELIAKAIGWKKDLALTVYDTTAGLGIEAFLIAAIGCDVTLFERHPQVAGLLKDALEKAKQHPDTLPVVSRMTLITTCAIEYLQNEMLTTPPDIIYCDPMFEPRPKSAAVKKEMQFLQSIVGTDQDSTLLATLALKTAKKRVVIKRAHYAPPLIDSPQICYKARSHRFDVYII